MSLTYKRDSFGVRSPFPVFKVSICVHEQTEPLVAPHEVKEGPRFILELGSPAIAIVTLDALPLEL